MWNMTKILTAAFIILSALTTNGQSSNSENPVFDSLDERMHRGEITSDEWYFLTLKAGYISEHSNGWVESTGRIDKNSELYQSLKTRSGFVFHIPDNYQIIDPKNGNRYIEAYLINLTDTVISIPRKDATVDIVESFLFTNNKWNKVKDSRQVGCGHGYWTQKLEPNDYIVLHIDNHDLALGTLQVKQKITINLNGLIVESEKVVALLNENQVKLLRQN
jgi:hypothetical protein